MPRDPLSIAIGIQKRLDTWASGTLQHVPAGNRGTLVRSMYVQQGVLTRLSLSPFAGNVIMGGAQALQLFLPSLSHQGGRVTRDLDLDLPDVSEEEELRTILLTVLQTPLPPALEDHLVFDPALAMKHILPGTEAGGYRCVIQARLGPKTRIRTTLDLALNLQIPGVQTMEFQPLLRSEPFPILAAPVEAVLAGKVAGLLKAGIHTTRLKDFFDLWFVATARDFAGSRLIEALNSICHQQRVPIDASAEIFASSALLGDPAWEENWQDFLQDHWLTAPPFPVVLQAVRSLYLPVLDGTAAGRIWQHQHQQWSAIVLESREGGKKGS